MGENYFVWDYPVFPAHAGMSPPARVNTAPHWGFPRSRGDEPRTLGGFQGILAFSPLTRG